MGYRHLGEDVHFRLETLGDGSVPIGPEDHVRSVGKVVPLFDTTLQVFHGDWTLTVPEANGLGRALRRMRVGDRASVILPLAALPKMLSSIADMDMSDTTWIWVRMTVDASIGKEEFERRSRERAAWVRDRELEERARLQRFVREQGADTISYWQSGMYVWVADSGAIDHARTGDLVAIHYEARTLDGRVIDDTRKGEGPFEFVIGEPGQVIRGMDMGLRALGVGGMATFVIPSDLAFGPDGSSSGIVPPFTTVVYEVEVIRLERGAG
ncbi:MAG: FKBP-type peptidyl-prolyl cis-trans isomerase [Flavobacteriales bacterium]|nr:FKBP-type peptidyl-prolyl cis-trans isomerase [Flavobacteriales bacterium]